MLRLQGPTPRFDSPADDGLDAVRAIARAKMLADFRSSHLNSSEKTLAVKGLSRSILRAAGIERSKRLELHLQANPITTAAYYGLENDDALKAFARRIAETGTVVRVMLTSIAAGAFAVLQSLRLRHSRFGLGEALHIDFKSLNGRDETRNLVTSAGAPDFVVAPDGAFFIKDDPILDTYRTIVPLFVQQQFVLRRTDYLAKSSGRIWTYPDSTVDAMVRAWIRSPRFDGGGSREWLLGKEIRPCEAVELPRLAAELDRTEMLAAWEPLAGELLHQAAERHKRDASCAALEKTPGSDFHNIFSLAVHERWTRPDNAMLSCVEELIISEWNHCRRHPDEAWRYLASDQEFLRYFCAGAGHEPPGAPDLPLLLQTHRRRVPSIDSVEKASAGSAATSTVLSIDTSTQEVRVDDNPVRLPLTQFALVLLLSRHANDEPPQTQDGLLAEFIQVLEACLAPLAEHEAQQTQKVLTRCRLVLEDGSKNPIGGILSDIRTKAKTRNGPLRKFLDILPRGKGTNLRIPRAQIRIA